MRRKSLSLLLFTISNNYSHLSVVTFSDFLPASVIAAAGTILALWIVCAMIFNMYRWRRSTVTPIKKQFGILGSRNSFKIVLDLLVLDVALQTFLWHGNKKRWLGHFTALWGFVLLAVATTVDWITNPSAAYLGLDSIVRIIGNLGGVLLIFGLTIAILTRGVYGVEGIRTTNASDVAFLAIIGLTALSGFGAEVARQVQSVLAMNAIYVLHLALVGILLGLAPFTKFVHAFGRPLVMLLDRCEMMLRRNSKFQA